MAVPSSNITVTSIWDEANTPTSIGTDVSFGDLAGYSYFDGPAGASTVGYNGWGQNSAGGVDRIYGLSVAAGPGPYNFGAFQNLVYFYDNSTYAVKITVNNNIAAATPPDPPNDVDCTVNLYDNSNTYSYVFGSSGNATEGGGQAVADITTGLGNEPILAVGYWSLGLSTLGNAAASADVTINGTSKVTGYSLSAGLNTIDWVAYGAEAIGNTGTFVGLDIVVDCY